MQKTINRRELMQKLAAFSIGAAAVPFAAVAQDTAPTTTIHIPNGSGKTGKVGEMDIIFKFSGKQTAGLLGLWETVMQPGELGAPPHYHSKTEEICRVLEGTVTIMTGDTITEVTAGGWHLRPKNIVHTFWNSGKVPAKTIDICLPAGHEDYMQELASMFENGRRPAPGEMQKLETKYDIHYRYDLLKGIMDKYGVKL